MVTKIQKRDGRVVDFTPEKITNAIRKAFIAVREGSGDQAIMLSKKVEDVLNRRFEKQIPGVEDVQDIVEEVLINEGYPDIAKAYILYRQRRMEIRRAKSFLGVKDELKLTVNAVSVLKRRYLLKDERGEIAETPAQMFLRVARTIASADRYSSKEEVKRIREEFYEMMVNLDFLPNTPTLMNAGTDIGQLSACFVIPVEDSMVSIFNALKHMALIHKSGGGTGFSFSKLRPKGDIVKSTKGVASGPLSFMRVFDTATEVIKQGGKRRGANMGILRVDHPDILDFITAKTREGVLANFNLSVSATDKFMEAVLEGEEYDLITPKTGEKTRRLKASDVFDLIVTMAWKTGDPGLVFIDRVNKANPTPLVGSIESTNPCGEQPLLSYESCNLGSINLLNVVSDGKIDFEKLRRVTRTAVHFLDNVIDANNYPLTEIEKMTKANRKIGLGVMGFAEALIKLGVPYNSKEAVRTAERLMRFISKEAVKMSVELGEKRGSFPKFQGSIWDKKGYKSMRNATTTTIAPTGTLSIIAGTSSGIEPLFAVSFVRNVMEGTQLLEVNPLFEEVAKRQGFYDEDLMMNIAKSGSIKEFKEIPEDVKKLFVTSFDISPEWHVRIQAAFQKYTDNAVSKTINFPHDATVESVKKAFLLAYEIGCKGITIYRYGSKRDQVLYIGSVMGKEMGEAKDYISAEPEYAGGCPTPLCL